MTTIKKILCLLSALALALTAAGCNRYKKGNYPVEEGGVSVTKEPSAVISLTPYLSEMIYGLDLQDKLVGRSEYCAFNGNVRELPDCGTVLEPDIDRILSLSPQLIFCAAELPAQAAEQIEDAGIKICLLPVPESVAEICDRINSVAAVLKGNNRVEMTANKYISGFNDRIELIKQSLEGVETPTGVFILSADGAVATGDTLIGEIMELAGVKNIAKYYTGFKMPKEDILAADPDVIIVTSPPSISYVSSDDELSGLRAASGGYIYEVPNYTAEATAPSVTDMLDAIAYAIHGDVLASLANEEM